MTIANLKSLIREKLLYVNLSLKNKKKETI
ncbi:Uncharacterised protein [Sphingobacterium thalpophilum]|uniref:Uncharacterized protein n=1 Tax=Sphingobacterium thalpophilum TaxID=259 RepID=A0A4U9VE82_9SPHI|nr:Uncharacterised protein [Sphingobacterium thalpophilum]